MIARAAPTNDPIAALVASLKKSTTEHSRTMTASVPDWLSDVDGEERRDLEQLMGAPVQGASDADLAASASQLLAHIRDESIAIERDAAAEAVELARIKNRYALLKDAKARRILALEQHLEILAEGLDYGKKKTRDVGNGKVGFRSVPARVSITDPTVLLAWATAYAPAVIKTETVVKTSVPTANVRTYFDTTGEVPAGCEFVPAREQLTYNFAPGS